jgi:flagellar hook-associated protein 3 FlgL
LSHDRLDAIRQGAGRAVDELQTVHTALLTASEVVARARTLTVQMANDSNNTTDRANAASEVDGMFKQMVGLMNTQVSGRFAFGGFIDNAPPFDNLGAYTGDAGVRQVEIAPGVLEDASVRADVAMKGVGGGVDVFAVLASLATALRGNDRAGLEAALSDLDTGANQITLALTHASNSVAVLETAESVNLLARDQITSELSRLADADIMASSTELALANRALEASLAASQKSFGPTLLDWLR